MTVVAIVGLCGAGKSSVAKRLVEKHGFKFISIKKNATFHQNDDKTVNGLTSPLSLIDINEFADISTAIEYVTNNWQQNFVMTCLDEYSEFEKFMLRPFFMVMAILAPVMIRFERCKTLDPSLDIEEFVKADDSLLYQKGLVHIFSSARLTISNDGPLDKLCKVIDGLQLDERWTRPVWDAYFMEMAELASRRSNCMKRCVGCIVVKDKRVLATGYNGTPRGLPNCCDGGCARCNGNAKCGIALETCLCLHAEDNALLEAGHSRCEGATLYCTTAPCLGCTIKLIQCGISKVVYAKEYSLAHDTSNLFRMASIEIVKFSHDYPRYIGTGAS